MRLCVYTYEVLRPQNLSLHLRLFFTSVCNDLLTLHCPGQMHCPLLRAAQQVWVTAALCLCIYTYTTLLFTPVWNDLRTLHCSTALRKMHCPLLSAAVQNETAGFVPAFFTSVRNDLTTLHCSTALPKMHCPLIGAALQVRVTAGFVPLQSHL